ncbi:MAG TPA: carbamoyltransferase HypF [Acidimicrobiales bacterium]|nr:carbamoyltransferase HypF [Acidimicrobiales bacterium]
MAGAERRELRVEGIVQGVGFRPFVYRHATRLGLSGWVRNDSAGVLIQAEGRPDAIDQLEELLTADPPPLAKVTRVATHLLTPTGERGFAIVETRHAGRPAAPVSPDVATCDDCLRELFDPADRRFRYPFINCTNCGPRYTIVFSVPYDRPATTMTAFRMCSRCQAEYDDPADRRFHAQPNACPDCGPRLRWTDPSGRRQPGDPLEQAIEALRQGRIVAVKGLGGYHLAVDAGDEAAVETLRRRKARDDKPFAVMVADVNEAGRLCDLGEAATAVLCQPARPIVLAPRRAADGLAGLVAPGLPELGVMLPYTPLHHLLMRGVGRPLVMTSGNLSDEPIAHDDAEAVERLGPLVDGMLAHDRAIHIRCDDSVVRVPAGQVLRRSRGYAPEPLALPEPARRTVLAVGAMLKNTVSVARDGIVVPSHHIGDLDHLATFQSFLQAVEHLPRLYGVPFELVAHDLHPEYLSTKFATDLDLATRAVQHHHAHVASCLVDNGRTERVLGIAFDGLGFGSDGTLWGGELLDADLSGFERVGHLRPVRMPGGATAIREPWRMAVAWLDAAGGADLTERIGPTLGPDWAAVARLAATDRHVTTSVGRLFDAAAALVGLRSQITYEGQAAIELEALAHVGDPDSMLPMTIDRTGELPVIDPAPAIIELALTPRRHHDAATAAYGFHAGLAEATAELACELARTRRLGTVALTGGVFQNSLFASLLTGRLQAAGLDVITHHRVPPNDGGISVGQAAIAALSD